MPIDDALAELTPNGLLKHFPRGRGGNEGGIPCGRSLRKKPWEPTGLSLGP